MILCSVCWRSEGCDASSLPYLIWSFQLICGGSIHSKSLDDCLVHMCRLLLSGSNNKKWLHCVGQSTGHHALPQQLRMQGRALQAHPEAVRRTQSQA